MVHSPVRCYSHRRGVCASILLLRTLCVNRTDVFRRNAEQQTLALRNARQAWTSALSPSSQSRCECIGTGVSAVEARYGRTAILREAPSLPSPASQGDRKLIVGLAKRGPRACYAGMAPT